VAAQPGGFLAVAVLLTGAVLVLARQSQSLVSDAASAPRESSDEQTLAPEPTVPDEQRPNRAGAEPGRADDPPGSETLEHADRRCRRQS